MIKCKICNTECKSFGSLSKHIRDKHKEYNSKLYYDEFLKSSTSGICEVCGAGTSFDNINKGYSATCSHTCAAILNRKRLAADTKKHAAFVNKVAKNQTRIWEERNLKGTAQEIHNKISNTVKQFNSTLTTDERKSRYGWLNKLSTESKNEWINSVMRHTGMHAWWKNASESAKQELYVKRNASKLGITLEEYQNRYNNLEEFENYRWIVWLLTEKTYKEYKEIIDPESKRSPAYHLDHKFSVIRGFQTKVPPEIIASVYNLEMLPASANSSKSGKCSINIELLKEMYYGKILPGNISNP